MKKLYKFLLNKLPRPLLIRLSYVFRIFAPALYRGTAVSCPVCEKSFSKFLSYGSEVAHRDNVLCPYDLTLERHRLMWLYLKNHSFFFTQENLSVLHMAPEQCFVDRFKAQKNLNYLTADLVSPIADLHFDLHQIPLEKDRFDVVFCNHVMEHVADPVQCMSELFRVLKPGGWANPPTKTRASFQRPIANNTTGKKTTSVSSAKITQLILSALVFRPLPLT